jgi:hypothetical protein
MVYEVHYGRVVEFPYYGMCTGFSPTGRGQGVWIMALRQSYQAAGEIPDALREHYGEKDGRWILQTDPPTDDVTGLKSALETERRLRRDADTQLTGLKTKFEGIDPDDVRKLKDRVKGLDEIDIYDKQGFEALLTKRTQSMKEDHDRVLAARERELSQVKETLTATDRKWREDRIKTALLAAATKAGVDKHAMPDAVQRGLQVFVDLDEHGNVIAKNGEDVRYGKDGVSPLSPDEWLLGLKPEAPHLWPASSGGGAPGHHNGVQGTDYSKITSPTERLTAFRQAQRGSRG